MRNLFATLSLLFCVIAAVSGRAEDVGQQARALVQHQLDAFANDDAAGAYALASPGIKSIFTDSAPFMNMVRGQYAPVYRHRSFEFGLARITDGKIIQEVGIVDADGVAWDAVYTLETQPDGNLKITACILKKAVTS